MWVGGLAQDVCVLHSVIDALKEGFTVKVIAEATRPVSEEDGRKAIEIMKTAGKEILPLILFEYPTACYGDVSFGLN